MVHIITDESCLNYQAPGHPERPARISQTLARLRSQKEVSIEWAAPLSVNKEILLRSHSENHLQALQEEIDFDGDTPAYPNIFEHALRSVGGALQALEFAQQ